jgi:hypothetical protein
MRTTSIALALALTSLTLAACAGPVQVVGANTDSVTLRHSADAGGAAQNEAVNRCAQYNKRAQLRTTHDDNGQKLTIYNCIP